MNIENIYNDSKNNFLYNNSKKFLDLRKNILDNFKLTPKIKKK